MSDFPILDELQALDAEERLQHLAELVAFAAELAEQSPRGGTVAAKLRREARRRDVLHDPTAAAWRAWADRGETEQQLHRMLTGAG